MISADSHPVSGAFTYSVGAPSTPPVDSGSDSRANPVVGTAVKVARFLGYAGLVLLVGPALVLAALWPRRLSRRGPTRLAWTGLGLVAVATLADLWLQVPYTAGGGLFDVTGEGFGSVFGSAFGAAHLVRLGLLAASVFLLRPLLARPTGRADAIILAVLGGAALLTWPLAGHPAASPAPAVSVVVDAVHLGSMAVWLGGLLMLAGFLLRQADERELGAILPIWSRWAALAVSALLLAGTVQALIEVATPQALFDTTYGRLLLAKIGLFALVIAVAAYSRQLVRRRVAAQRPAPVRRAVWVELAVTVVVLGLSATLVQTTPARTAVAGPSSTEAGLFSTRLSSPLYEIAGRGEPGRAGQQLGAPVRVRQGQPAAAGRGVEGDRRAALGRDRTDRRPVAAVDGQPRLRRHQPAGSRRLATEDHRPNDRHRPGHGDRHRADPLERSAKPMTRIRRTATAAAALAFTAAATAVLGFAGPASAHVTVNPKEATQGGYARVAFRVPNESDTASTTKLEVVLPENAPVGSVSTMPVPGWTVAMEKRKVDPPIEVHGSQLTEAVSKITWTATGDAAVKPGQFQEFPVSMGPLPQVDSMVFKVLQTYSDGNISRWIDEPAPGAEEPENPAPVLTLTAAAAPGRFGRAGRTAVAGARRRRRRRGRQRPRGRPRCGRSRRWSGRPGAGRAWRSRGPVGSRSPSPDPASHRWPAGPSGGPARFLESAPPVPWISADQTVCVGKVGRVLGYGGGRCGCGSCG